MPPVIDKIRTPEQSGAELQERLDDLLDQEVSPDNIDFVADYSLDTLVGIVQDCVQSHGQQPTDTTLSAVEREDAAFAHFGLQSIRGLLDRIHDKIYGIHRIDSHLSALHAGGLVITPPDLPQQVLIAGDGSYEQAGTVPRLKTLLYVLNQHLGVDLANITLKKGTNSPDMLRKESYVSVEVPELNRSVLVCDEEGNATFVFDLELLLGIGVTSDVLVDMTKQELKELLHQHPTAGSKLHYSPNWAGNMLDLLTTTFGGAQTPAPKPTPKPVKLFDKITPAPDDVRSINGLAKHLGLSGITILKAVKAVRETMPEDFGDVTKYRFGRAVAEGLSLDQQSLVAAELEYMGVLTSSAPEGILSTEGLAKHLGLSGVTIRKTVKAVREKIPEDFGNVTKYRFGCAVAVGLSLDQQSLVAAELEYMGVLTSPAPEGILSAAGLAKQLGTSINTIRKTVKAVLETMPEDFGEVTKYRFGLKVAVGFSLEQQSLIVAMLEYSGAFSPPAPEGVLSLFGLARHIGKDNRTVAKAIEAVKDTMPEDFGEVTKYRFVKSVGIGYSPKQQEMIKQYLGHFGIEK